MPNPIDLNINGRLYTVEVELDTPLLFVLHNDLKLKGAKYACGLEQCGACKVIVDGEAVPSCQRPVSSVIGSEIITVEGLGMAAQLHPLQAAFIDEQAAQCGFCTAGMLIAGKALLDKNPHPTIDEINHEMERNLCRCGVYDRIRHAIQRAAGNAPEPSYTVQTMPPLAQRMSENELPRSLQQHPQLDQWVQINKDETITVLTGKVELGQGLRTALAQLAAEELEVAIGRINLVTADTALTPDEGRTTGSMSLETSGNAIRYATAEARHVLLTLAFEELEAAAFDDLVVDDGTIRDSVSGRAVTYWQLMGGKQFGRLVSGAISPKQPENHQVVGQSTPRIDLLAKVMGQPSYVHDLELPHMVHGRVVRPPHYHARLVSVDTDVIEALPGILKVVLDGSFLGVIAEREEQAVAAMQQLQATAVWEAEQTLLPSEQLFDHLNSAPAESFLLVDGTPTQEPIPAMKIPDTAAYSCEATYIRPYQMHGSLGPSAAVAHWHEEQLTVWTHSQGVFPTRAILAQVLGIDENRMHVIQMEGPGCYGHNGADDAALDAVLLARAVPNRPLMLKWSRADEHAWEPYGPAMQVRVQGSVDESGQINRWQYDVWSYPHLGRGRPDGHTSGLLAAWHLEKPFAQPVPQTPLWPHVGGYRNADPLYDLPERRVVTHFVAQSPLRTSTLRSLGAYTNVFAIESFIDELAYGTGIDPVEFRLRHLTDERARAVIQTAAEKVGWHNLPAEKQDGFGRGIAFAQYKNRQCYAAIVVELHVDRASGRIQLERAVIAADAGLVVNPDGLCNQLEGGFLQAASWTLYEEVRFDEQGIRSTDWLTYPILRFPAAPRIETVLLNRPDMPFLGSGEATQGPAPAAIANAVFDAVGVRLREIPFTPERVTAALRS